VKRAFAIALSVLIVLVAAAPASAAVQITFKTWKVTTKNGKQHDVQRGGTFVRCGRKVVKVTAAFDYAGATPGKNYKNIWSVDGNDVLKSTQPWPHASGTRRVSLFKASGNPIPDGKYRFRLRQDGKGIGSSSISVRPGSGC
jgi:hypothetical protein